MFNDRQKWIKITEEYQNSENQPGTLELSVKVLTHNNWDLPNGSKLNMKGERIDQETSNSSADPSKNRPQPHQSNTSNSSNMSDITLNNQNTLGSNSVSHTSNLNASSSISASGKVSKSSHSYLPREMTLAFDHFKNYYLKRDNNNNKILTLIPDLGTGDIKFTPQGLKAQGKKLRTYWLGLKFKFWRE